MWTKKNKIYFCGGVNGVGKSSFLQTLILTHPEFEVLSGSKKLMEWLNLKSGDYNSLRDLNDDYKNDELDKMMNKILRNRKSTNKKLIIDGHYFNYNRGDIIDCVGNWISLVDALFVISASPETILRRVKKDEIVNSYERNLFPTNLTRDRKLSILKIFLEITQNKAKEISKKYNLPLFIINNDQNGFNNIIEKFSKYESTIL